MVILVSTGIKKKMLFSAAISDLPFLAGAAIWMEDDSFNAHTFLLSDIKFYERFMSRAVAEGSLKPCADELWFQKHIIWHKINNWHFISRKK